MGLVTTNSLTRRLLLYMAPAALLLLGLLYLGFQLVVNDVVSGLAKDFTEQNIRLNREKFASIIRQELTLSRMMVTTPDIIQWAMDEDNPVLKRRAIALLDGYRSAFHDHRYFFVADHSKHYYFNDASTQNRIQIKTTLSSKKQADAWYFATKQAGRQCQINIGIDEYQTGTNLWINCLIRHGKKVVGMAGTGINLTHFIDTVVNNSRAGVNSLYINRQGAIQVAPDKERIDFNSLTHDAPSNKTLLAIFDRPQDRQTFIRMQQQLAANPQRVITMPALIHGTSHIVGIAKVEETDWYGVTFVNLEQLQIRRLFFPFALISALAALLLLALLITIINRLVLSRIRRLDSKVQQLKEGDYHIGDCDPSPDEIGRLDTGFTEMADAVRQHASHLEEKVAERTAELERASQEAQAANRSKSEFLSVMSHEIRTPMNAIIGMTHLAMRTELTPQQRDYLTKAHHAANSLLGIINDILDFSKIEAGKMELESIPFNLEEVLNNLATMSGIRAHEKGLEIYFQLDDDVPHHLIGDPLRLGQVLLNLTNNALKFTEQGEITVHIHALQRETESIWLEFTVEDTGIGLSQPQIDRLFQSFSQADSSITRKYGGTGLGLAICKRLVERMSGEIRVESTPRVGSRFIFSAQFGLQQQQRSEQLAVPEPLQGMRVLVVDDSATSRRVMQHYLEELSMQADTVASGEEALDMLNQANEPYQLVLMDWKMPGIDGIETSRRIKNHPNLEKMPTVIMVTAYGRDEVMEQAHEAKLDGFLIKPVEKSLLHRVIISTFGYESVEPDSQQDSTEEASALRGARVLVVEDNRINQQIAREILTQAGLVVAVANHGSEAVHMVMMEPFDAVLMDLQMPEMDGYEATRTIRADGRFSGLPIIAMTAHARDEERERCLAVGMNDHIAKPIDPDLLLKLLRRWLPSAKHPAPQATAARDDHQPAEQLPGIDLATGLQKLGGNRQLLYSLLQEFSQEFADAGNTIRTLLAAGDRKAAERLAHTVRGTAGNLAAIPLYRTAGKLEQAISLNDEIALNDLLSAFSNRLTELLKSITTLNPQPSETAPITDASNTTINATLSELETLIGDNSMDADRCFAKLKTTLHRPDTLDAMQQLEAAINGFDFAKADAILSLIKQKVTSELGG